MNPKPSAGLPSHLTLCSTLLIAAALWNSHAPAATPAPGPGESVAPQAIPWTQLGAAAGAQYSGEGLTVSQTEQGARLSCVFQRLDGEATREGLWLSSTAPDQPNDRFRVIAVEIGREGRAGSPLTADGAHGVTRPTRLPATGEVSVDGQTVRFTRPGMVEEYTVSMDGVRQDFVVLEKPPLTLSLSPLDGERVASRPGEGELRLELAVTGAWVEPIAGGVHPVRYAGQAGDHERGNMLSHGARLVLEKSGRKIAYSRLRVTDATGKELAARMEVLEDGARRSRRFDVESAAGAEANLDALEMSAVKRPEGRAPILAVLVDDAQAVYPIRIDPTFSDANWISMSGILGANGSVYAAVTDASGNLYIGGMFTMAGDGFAAHIAKWNGSSWSALGSGMNGYVHALAVSGSDLYAGGNFSTAGGSAANRVAKWNGSNWSALGSGIGGTVYALAMSGADLYAGGVFTTAGGSPASRVAKWNGSSWSALGSGIGGTVYALAVAGIDLYAGGQFSTAGGAFVSRIARWDGSSWSKLGSGVSSTVRALAVSGSDVYAGGIFTTAGGVSANGIARWDGNSWSALGSGMNNEVRALAVSGSDVYAGGNFTTAGGSPANRIAKWNGSSWSALDSGMKSPINADCEVNALAVLGSDVYAGGQFSAAGAVSANRIAKWDASRWSALGSGMNGEVLALAVSGGDLYAGGFFTTAGRIEANRIVWWTESGWIPLGSGLNERVLALAVSGSNVYAGGAFRTAGGIPANCIAKWDGIGWSALGSGIYDSSSYPAVTALAVSGNNLYAGGYFDTAGDIGGIGIAKWDGNKWSAMNTGYLAHGGSRGYVCALAVSGNDLYAAGHFTMIGDVMAYNIAKWNGSSWSALGAGLGAASHHIVYALAVSGSNLYAGGDFTTAGGIPANNIAKWNGTSWSALGSGLNGPVHTLVVLGDDVYAGGSFTTAGGIGAMSIAKWNGSSWSGLGSGMNNSYVYALAASEGDLYAGGTFATAGGKVSAYIARAVLGVAPGYNQLTGAPSSEGAMQFSYIGYPATNYALDRAFDLSPPISWVGQQTNTMTVSGVLSFTNTPVPGTNNFWRVRSVP